MNSQSRLPVALPAYESELIANQRAALRTAAPLACTLLLAFTFLDRATVPEAWLLLLCIRLAAGAGLLAVRRGANGPLPPVPLTAFAMALVAGASHAAVFVTGGARSPYITAHIALLAGVGLLLPFTAKQALFMQLFGLATALVPLLFGLQPGDLLPLVNAASYLLTVSIVAVAGAHLQDLLRRREHRARVEVARQMGLINLGTLAGGLAHELSNPLTWVGLELESIEGGPLDAQNRERVRSARTGLDRMRDILAAMRQGARFASGELREVMLSSELDQALTLVAQRLRDVAVLREYEPGVPLVSCQPTLLGQLLVNLVLNAVDAMSAQKERRLTVRVRCQGAQAVVEVEDSGPGVPEELRARIFEPFFSTKGEKGNGLGLWISSEIARVHGGELSALPGTEGALFRLCLPVEGSLPASSAA